jgi:hypothetical protein
LRNGRQVGRRGVVGFAREGVNRPRDEVQVASVQHTLGKKNQTFHLLGASATALIEQEAELINASSGGGGLCLLCDFVPFLFVLGGLLG